MIGKQPARGSDRVVIRAARDDGVTRVRLAYLAHLMGDNFKHVDIELVPPKVEPSLDEEDGRARFGWSLGGEKGMRYWVRDRVRVPRGCYPMRCHP
jgi:hypothetical protein